MAAMAALLVSCRSSHDPTRLEAVDLVARLPGADCRPAGRCDVEVSGRRHYIRLAAPGRLTWILPLPQHAVLRTEVSAVGGPVGFRVGIADDRTYEVLATLPLTPEDGWKPLEVDLSAYAGWKWSLFYHPDRIRWRIILSSDAVQGRTGVGLWGAPRIAAPPEAILEYRRIPKPKA